MSEKPPLSQKFLETMPYIMQKASKQKQLQMLLYILQDYPEQFQEFIENFGIERYNKIMPRS